MKMTKNITIHDLARELELDSLQDLIRDYEAKKLSSIIQTVLKSHTEIEGKVFRIDK